MVKGEQNDGHKILQSWKLNTVQHGPH